MHEMTPIEHFFAEWGPPIAFIAGGLGAAIVVFRFQWRTFQLVKVVQEIEKRRGRDWPFWSDPYRTQAFTFSPSSLIDPSDPQDLMAAKTALVHHRSTVRAYLMPGFCLLFGGALLAIAIPITIGLILHFDK